MLHKVNRFIAIITIILVIVKLINPSFEPFENFIFAWLSFMFLLLGLEFVIEKSKAWGSIFIIGSLLILFLIFTQ